MDRAIENYTFQPTQTLNAVLTGLHEFLCVASKGFSGIFLSHAAGIGFRVPSDPIIDVSATLRFNGNADLRIASIRAHGWYDVRTEALDCIRAIVATIPSFRAASIISRYGTPAVLVSFHPPAAAVPLTLAVHVALPYSPFSTWSALGSERSASDGVYTHAVMAAAASELVTTVLRASLARFAPPGVPHGGAVGVAAAAALATITAAHTSPLSPLDCAAIIAAVTSGGVGVPLGAAAAAAALPHPPQAPDGALLDAHVPPTVRRRCVTNILGASSASTQWIDISSTAAHAPAAAAPAATRAGQPAPSVGAAGGDVSIASLIDAAVASSAAASASPAYTAPLALPPPHASAPLPPTPVLQLVLTALTTVAAPHTVRSVRGGDTALPAAAAVSPLAVAITRRDVAEAAAAAATLPPMRALAPFGVADRATCAAASVAAAGGFSGGIVAAAAAAASNPSGAASLTAAGAVAGHLAEFATAQAAAAATAAAAGDVSVLASLTGVQLAGASGGGANGIAARAAKRTKGSALSAAVKGVAASATADAASGSAAGGKFASAEADVLPLQIALGCRAAAEEIATIYAALWSSPFDCEYASFGASAAAAAGTSAEDPDGPLVATTSATGAASGAQRITSIATTGPSKGANVAIHARLARRAADCGVVCGHDTLAAVLGVLQQVPIAAPTVGGAPRGVVVAVPAAGAAHPAGVRSDLFRVALLVQSALATGACGPAVHLLFGAVGAGVTAAAAGGATGGAGAPRAAVAALLGGTSGSAGGDEVSVSAATQSTWFGAGRVGVVGGLAGTHAPVSDAPAPAPAPAAATATAAPNGKRKGKLAAASAAAAAATTPPTSSSTSTSTKGTIYVPPTAPPAPLVPLLTRWCTAVDVAVAAPGSVVETLLFPEALAGTTTAAAAAGTSGDGALTTASACGGGGTGASLGGGSGSAVAAWKRAHALSTACAAVTAAVRGALLYAVNDRFVSVNVSVVSAECGLASAVPAAAAAAAATADTAASGSAAAAAPRGVAGGRGVSRRPSRGGVFTPSADTTAAALPPSAPSAGTPLRLTLRIAFALHTPNADAAIIRGPAASAPPAIHAIFRRMFRSAVAVRRFADGALHYTAVMGPSRHLDNIANATAHCVAFPFDGSVRTAAIAAPAAPPAALDALARWCACSAPPAVPVARCGMYTVEADRYNARKPLDAVGGGVAAVKVAAAAKAPMSLSPKGVATGTVPGALLSAGAAAVPLVSPTPFALDITSAATRDALGAAEPPRHETQALRRAFNTLSIAVDAVSPPPPSQSAAPGAVGSVGGGSGVGERVVRKGFPVRVKSLKVASTEWAGTSVVPLRPHLCLCRRRAAAGEVAAAAAAAGGRVATNPPFAPDGRAILPLLQGTVVGAAHRNGSQGGPPDIAAIFGVGAQSPQAAAATAAAAVPVNRNRLPRWELCVCASVRPVDVVVELEDSQRWPNTLAAVRATKTALGVRLAKCLAKRRVVTAAVAMRDCVHVVIGGFVFALHLTVSRDLRVIAASPAGAVGANMYSEAVVVKPQHVDYLRVVAASYPSFPACVRTVLRWFDAHMTWPAVSQTAVELFVAAVYTSLDAASAGTATAGFVRVLTYMAAAFAPQAYKAPTIATFAAPRSTDPSTTDPAPASPGGALDAAATATASAAVAAIPVIAPVVSLPIPAEAPPARSAVDGRGRVARKRSRREEAVAHDGAVVRRLVATAAAAWSSVREGDVLATVMSTGSSGSPSATAPAGPSAGSGGSGTVLVCAPYAPGGIAARTTVDSLARVRALAAATIATLSSTVDGPAPTTAVGGGPVVWAVPTASAAQIEMAAREECGTDNAPTAAAGGGVSDGPKGRGIQQRPVASIFADEASASASTAAVTATALLGCLASSSVARSVCGPTWAALFATDPAVFPLRLEVSNDVAAAAPTADITAGWGWEASGIRGSASAVSAAVAAAASAATGAARARAEPQLTVMAKLLGLQRIAAVAAVAARASRANVPTDDEDDDDDEDDGAADGAAAGAVGGVHAGDEVEVEDDGDAPAGGAPAGGAGGAARRGGGVVAVAKSPAHGVRLRAAGASASAAFSFGQWLSGSVEYEPLVFIGERISTMLAPWAIVGASRLRPRAPVGVAVTPHAQRQLAAAVAKRSPASATPAALRHETLVALAEAYEVIAEKLVTATDGALCVVSAPAAPPAPVCAAALSPAAVTAVAGSATAPRTASRGAAKKGGAVAAPAAAPTATKGGSAKGGKRAARK